MSYIYNNPYNSVNSYTFYISINMHNSSLKLFYNFYLSLDVYSVKEKTVSFLK